MSAEVANIILSTQDPVNPPSFINAQKTNFIFRNVDLRSLLGEMWNKYEMFLIKPITISNTPTTALTNVANGLFTYNLKGLSWTNINYETTPNQKIWAPVFQQIASISLLPVLFYTNNGWGYTFRKGSPIVDLEFAISLLDATGVGGIHLPAAGNNYGDTSMQFSVEPVVKGYNECAMFAMNINPVLSTANGRVGVNQRVYTYYSFDLQDLCREFWADYDEFEILMNWYLNRGSYVSSTLNQQAPIQLSGLDFYNSLTKQGNDTTNANANYSQENPIVATVIVPSSDTTNVQNTTMPNAPVQFKKSGDRARFEWSIRDYDNTAVTSATGTTSLITMGFTIRPVYKVEKGTLYLNTWGLTTTETNLGVRNSTYTSVTLKNIDLRLVCKSFWEKYNKYNLYLTSYAMAYGSGGGATSGAESGLLKLEGFNMINQTTVQTTNNAQTQIATLGVINLSASLTGIGFPNAWSNNLVTSFYKTADLVNITLKLEQIGTTAFTGSPLLGSFVFTIVPIKE